MTNSELYGLLISLTLMIIWLVPIAISEIVTAWKDQAKGERK